MFISLMRILRLMSLQLTKNNHFEFELVVQDNIRQFYVKLGSPQESSTTSFHQSALDAQYFYDNSILKKIILCLSGGIDSESMCRAFLQAQIPFEVVFLRFIKDLNLFDIKTNIEFCDAKNVKYSFVDLDIIDFYESGKYFEVAKKYECQSPQIAAHLWFLDQIDGVPCMSGNPIAPVWQNDKWFFMGLPGELHSTYFKYFYINNREGIPWFFIYSPEMIKSFLNLDCMKPYLKRQVTGAGDYTYLEKCRS